MHVVGSIQSPIAIDKQRPLQPRLDHVLTSRILGFKRDNERPDTKLRQVFPCMLQLQHMPPAWQSEQVPVKHQQQALPLIIFKAMQRSSAVMKRKRDCLTAHER